MASATEVRNFALENNCSDAIALKVLTLQKWRRVKRQEFLMDEALADKCLSQLQQLGFTNTAKRAENEIARKWVPTKTDAAAL